MTQPFGYLALKENMFDHLQTIGEEVVMGCFKMLSCHFCGMSEDNHKKKPSPQLMP
jgi:hypothetical protein